ncbi:MAG: acyl-CoA dehydrogenase [Rhodobiaceae bacterium]|nr:acyl-CoA dehydrogenase [Rhodobiaceae bacterium]MCC0054778.1 acyl-CoA dehydrogenase [Rhodobiaceae bacterium]
MSFQAPVADMLHTLRRAIGLDADIAGGRLGDLTDDVLVAVLEEAGRFAAAEIAPLNRLGDTKGAVWKDGEVTTPAGWKEAYKAWVEGGWAALSCPAEFGGQDLPLTVGMAAQEIWNSAAMSFGINPVLTAGAVEALTAHGSDDLKDRYLGKLVSGEWTGTMNLTEPQAGSDLALLKSRAERAGDGTYRVFGTKIFITYGEHDLAENIVHLVLARLPDAPAGTRGISLFLVPKFLPDGTRNDIVCAGIEHKMGLHGSPTCTLIYGEKGGATGWLIGEENKGLNCMFTMMNNARLAVGIQGVAVAERAWQQARIYAGERQQGRLPGMGPTETVAIVAHPDIRRSLAQMEALTAASRAICYATARAIDLSALAPDEESRRAAKARADLLTPLAKAFSTDMGVEVASLGVQVHGGMGFIEETGAAQHLRDARITPIYEGTNGIQAIDLVTRKLPMAGGAVAREYIAEIAEIAQSASGSDDPALKKAGAYLSEAVSALTDATDWILKSGNEKPDDVLAGATPYLRLFSLAAGGSYLLRGAIAATAESDPDAAQRRRAATFFAANFLPSCEGLARTVTEAADTLPEAAAFA